MREREVGVSPNAAPLAAQLLGKSISPAGLAACVASTANSSHFDADESGNLSTLCSRKLISRPVSKTRSPSLQHVMSLYASAFSSLPPLYDGASCGCLDTPSRASMFHTLRERAPCRGLPPVVYRAVTPKTRAFWCKGGTSCSSVREEKQDSCVCMTSSWLCYNSPCFLASFHSAARLMG